VQGTIRLLQPHNEPVKTPSRQRQWNQTLEAPLVTATDGSLESRESRAFRECTHPALARCAQRDVVGPTGGVKLGAVDSELNLSFLEGIVEKSGCSGNLEEMSIGRESLTFFHWLPWCRDEPCLACKWTTE
jgi:hypothetical protein